MNDLFHERARQKHADDVFPFFFSALWHSGIRVLSLCLSLPLSPSLSLSLRISSVFSSSLSSLSLHSFIGILCFSSPTFGFFLSLANPGFAEAFCLPLCSPFHSPSRFISPLNSNTHFHSPNFPVNSFSPLTSFLRHVFSFLFRMFSIEFLFSQKC